MTRPATERRGILGVQLAFTESFDWLPRELPTSDHGIDMIVEEVRDQKPTGRLIAVQVKSDGIYDEAIVVKNDSDLEEPIRQANTGSARSASSAPTR